MPALTFRLGTWGSAESHSRLTGSGRDGVDARRLQCIQKNGTKNHRRPREDSPQPFRNISAERGKGAILSAIRNQTATKPAKSALTLRNVLFATDFSAACNNAWWYALALARQYSAKLFVAHVISPDVYVSVPPELLGEAQKRNRLEAEAKMDSSGAGTVEHSAFNLKRCCAKAISPVASCI